MLHSPTRKPIGKWIVRIDIAISPWSAVALPKKTGWENIVLMIKKQCVPVWVGELYLFRIYIKELKRL